MVKRADLPVEVMVAGAMGEGLELSANMALEHVQQLRETNPEFTQQQISTLLVREKVKYALLAGLVCALPVIALKHFPLFFMLFAVSLCAAMDALIMVKLCTDLVLEVHSVMGNSIHPTNTAGLMNLVLKTWGLKGLSENATQAETNLAGQVMTIRFGTEFVKRMVLIVYPLAGIPLCMVYNAYELYVISSRAISPTSSMPFVSRVFPKQFFAKRLPQQYTMQVDNLTASIGLQTKAYFAKTWGQALKN